MVLDCSGVSDAAISEWYSVHDAGCCGSRSQYLPFCRSSFYCQGFIQLPKGYSEVYSKSWGPMGRGANAARTLQHNTQVEKSLYLKHNQYYACKDTTLGLLCSLCCASFLVTEKVVEVGRGNCPRAMLHSLKNQRTML